jgi:hypothetical protein
MTMVNCLTLGRAGYMMCDTAEFGVPSLVVRGFGDKIATLEQQRMLIATRGEASLGPRFAEAVAERFDSFDDFISDAEPFLRDFDRHRWPLLDERLRLPDGDGTAVFIVGFSARRRTAECWSVSVDGGSGSVSSRPLTLDIEGAQFITAPSPGRDRLANAAIFGPAGFAADPEAALLHVAELQRWTGVRVNGSPRYYIGGEVVLARIDERGISKRVLKDWGDRPDTLILPKELPPPPRIEPMRMAA